MFILFCFFCTCSSEVYVGGESSGILALKGQHDSVCFIHSVALVTIEVKKQFSINICHAYEWMNEWMNE